MNKAELAVELIQLGYEIETYSAQDSWGDTVVKINPDLEELVLILAKKVRKLEGLNFEN